MTTRPPLPPGPVKPVRRRVTGLTSQPLDGDSGRCLYRVFLRPETGNGDNDTLYVEASATQAPYKVGDVLTLNPLLLAPRE